MTRDNPPRQWWFVEVTDDAVAAIDIAGTKAARHGQNLSAAVKGTRVGNLIRAAEYVLYFEAGTKTVLRTHAASS
ncbi:hypothetical protein B1T45_05280 [Mycobacterium kansasii]|nr:hypothetical protein MKAN_23845 [Mycobacterium kansasii ATCC 12478]ARG60818.1 hypothetical protein B1T45_05280 [Mycobacterium kansasii]EUA21948.1 hypothetical protein I545_0939 [Mycobacterium kansasii 662]ARG68512.1 hypothetical protein B1T47_05040 [Mycobacterium kansasii]ARG76848.1 hypothetical protein B1T51_23005 [Mycobacterium kansasii]